MSIMDMFRSTPAQPATPVAQPAATPGNIPENAAAATASTATPGTAANGLVPATANVTDKTQSPLDPFGDIWNNDPAKSNASGQPLFNIDMQALQNAARSVDFRTAIKPEHLTAMAAGGEGAVAAFGDALNSVAQELYGKSALASMKLIEGAIGKSTGNLKAELPTMIRNHNVSDSLRTENPALSHPAAQPLIESVQSTLALKYPTATASELREMANNYLSAFAAAAVPQKPVVNNTGGNKGGNDFDWSTFG